MKRFLMLFAVSLFVIFTACKSTSTFVRPEYAGKTIRQASLVIVPLGDNFIVDNPELNEEMGIDLTDESFVDAFGSQFKAYMAGSSHFHPVEYAKFTEDPVLYQRQLKMEEGKTLTLNLPGMGAALPLGDQSADFILFTQDLRIWLGSETKTTDKPGEHYKVFGDKDKNASVSRIRPKDYFIFQSMKYALINNKTMDIVFYGSISRKDKIDFNKGFNDSFGKAIKKMVKEIVKTTPFELK